jgi:hypothetical protein
MKVAPAAKVDIRASTFVAPVLRAISQPPSAAEQIPSFSSQKLTSGQANNPTRALKKARASLTLQLRKLASGQANN